MVASMIGAAFKNVLLSAKHGRINRFHSLALEGIRDGSASHIRNGAASHKPKSAEQQKAPPSTYAELSAKIDRLSNAYSVGQLKHVLVASNSTPLNAQASRLLLDSALRKAPITDLRHVRAHLATGTNAQAVQLDEASLSKAVERVVELGDAPEGMQWLLLAEKAYGAAPSLKSRDAVLRASAKLRNWDAVHFLLEDRRGRGVPLGAALVTSILRGAFEQPSGRWRVAKDLAVEAGVGELGPSALGRVFRILDSAGQHKAAHALYYRLASRVTAGESSPLFAAQSVASLTMVAHKLNSFSLLRDTLSNFSAELLRASSTAPAAAGADASGVTSHEAEAVWLLQSVKAMSEAYPDAPFDVASAVGSAVSWLLAAGQTDSAQSLWSGYTSALGERAAVSGANESARQQQAVDEALRLIASAAVDSSVGHLSRTAAFLRVFVSNGGGSIGSDASEAATAPGVGQSIALLDGMIRIFTNIQDVDAVSTLFSRRLQRGGLPADSALTPALQLIQQSGDHSLVLKLFNYYLSIVDPRHAMRKMAVHAPPAAQKSSSKKKPPAKRQQKLVPGAFAPSMFVAALSSLITTGDFAAMVTLLTEEMPARGFVPREGAFVQAIAALCKNGLFSEGTSLFAQSQQAYGALLEASRQGSGFAPPGYGVGSVPLVDVALRCCAQGMLGVTALEVFEALETAHRKGHLQLSASDVDTLTEQVLLALATPDFVNIIPRFLQSNRNLPVNMVSSRKALKTGLAAAVFVGDEVVALELVHMLEAAHGRSLADITSAEQLQANIARLFSAQDEAARLCVANFLQRLR